MEDPNCKTCHSLTDSHPGACLVCNNGYAKNSSTGWKCKKLDIGEKCNNNNVCKSGNNKCKVRCCKNDIDSNCAECGSDGNCKICKPNYKLNSQKNCELDVVDGGFTSWSNCSKSCGTGIQTRQCSNPSPKNGGKHVQVLYRKVVILMYVQLMDIGVIGQFVKMTKNETITCGTGKKQENV